MNSLLRQSQLLTNF